MLEPASGDLEELTNLTSVTYVAAPDPYLYFGAMQGVFRVKLTEGAEAKPEYVTLGWREPTALIRDEADLVVGLSTGELFTVPLGGPASQTRAIGRVEGGVRNIVRRTHGDRALYAGSERGLFRKDGNEWQRPTLGGDQVDLSGGVGWLFEDPLIPGPLLMQVRPPAKSGIVEISEKNEARAITRPIQSYHSMFIDVDSAHLYAPTAADKEFHITAIGLALNLDARMARQLSMAIAPSAPQTIYIGVDCCGVQVVTRTGFRWEAKKTKSSGGAVRSLVVHPTNDKMVFISTDTAILRSTDSGESWAPLYQSKVAPLRKLASPPGFGMVLPSQ
ncbi:MAG: hypothetical protein HYV63_03140 [Candidatus Schekmanbacteria bacterium]|nr:hypothetical protein [Candidatus Schekmanbacteria bacterium]